MKQQVQPVNIVVITVANARVENVRNVTMVSSSPTILVHLLVLQHAVVAIKANVLNVWKDIVWQILGVCHISLHLYLVVFLEVIIIQLLTYVVCARTNVLCVQLLQTVSLVIKDFIFQAHLNVKHVLNLAKYVPTPKHVNNVLMDTFVESFQN